jgi:DnaK suppressor protein
MAQDQGAALPLGELRHQLEEERARLEHEIFELTSGDEAVTPTDPVLDNGGMASDQADDADALSQAERNHAITAHTQLVLAQVKEALRRMDAGTYGICANCGKPIAPARLKALPSAAFCIDCQARLEARRRLGGR